MKIALVTEVFTGEHAAEHLGETLRRAGAAGAVLAVLPELPLDPWFPATRTSRPEDAEPPEGPRHRLLSSAAAETGIGVIGGAVVQDPATGKRHNTALVIDGGGSLLATYRKLHLPEEEGFWETSHYEPGGDPPAVIDGLDARIGIQLCSDINRPEGCQLLGASGAEAIFAPRCTPLESYERWKLVLRANAVTSGAWVVSTNRPRLPESVIGGPSVAIAPDGEIRLETTEAVRVIDLDRDAVRRARKDYPGYLPYRADLYARAWRALIPH